LNEQQKDSTQRRKPVRLEIAQQLTFGGGGECGAEETVAEPVARQHHELVGGVRLEAVNAHRRRRLAARDHVDRLPVVATVRPLVPAAARATYQ